ncbi:YhgE/Pip domain-containing protein [Gryllotalpicola kribbensis]|uniref:YhgE/Pip domain-containing protein n=1 Tax=Gryllotalpicola kribbensis TaxID=993084 RepID=A0ABP8AQF7_9MICO
MARPLQTETDKRRGRAVRIAIGAIACIPLIYGGALVWANQDPTHRLDKIPAAVVDLDQPVTQNGTTVDVGKQLAHELVTDDADNDFDWVETDASAARAGLKDGTYLATITLPKDLSANAASLGSDTPLDAAASKVTITTDDGHNYIVGVASKTVGLAISQSAAKSVSQQYLSQIYAGFNQIGGKLGEAADGAKQLASGAGSLESGTTTLVTGAQQSATGASQLASGLGTLSSGAQSLKSGTAQVSSGASTLSNGAGQLAGGADTLSSGLTDLKNQTTGLPDSASQLNSGAQALQKGLAGSGTASDPGYTGGVDRLADSCATIAANPLTAADPIAAQLCDGINQVAGAKSASGYANSVALRTGAQQLATGTSKLSAQAPALANGIAQASAGASQLDSKLHDAASGAQTLASGAQQAASGASQLASAAAQAHSGAQQLATGTAQLADGAKSLDAGAQQLSSGSSQLADKLAEGKASVPSYDDAEKTHLSGVAAQPISLAETKLHSVPSYGYGLAPYFLALGAWVGGLSIYMILRAIPHRAIAAGRPGWLAALLGYLRGAWISLVQAALLYLVVTLGIGVHPAHPVGLALFMGLTSLAFTAVNHTLMVLFGSRGRFLGLILLVLQVAAAGATYPIQTTPAFFQVLHGLLPLTYGANAIRSLIAGGSAGVSTGVVVMVCWMFAALVISVGATALRHKRNSELLLPDFAI